MSLSPRARDALLLGAITLVGAALRLHGVAHQPVLPDEDWVAVTAVHYVRSGQLGPTMWYHPNLRNLVTWAVGETLGHGPLALRSTSLVLGILSIPLTAASLHLLTKDRLASLAAAFLLAVDGVHVAFSRQAIQETWTAFFVVLGTALAVMAWEGRAGPWILALSGIAFGLGLSCKLQAAFPLAILGAAGLARAWRERSGATAAWIAASLAVLPALVFLLTYAPWFARGYGIAEWFELQRVLLAKMATHAGNPMDQVIDVAAWQWFLRPMGYASFVLSGGAPFVTLAFSNPAVWLLVLPAAAWIVRPAAGAPRAAMTGARFVLLLFAASYLPLAVASRPIWLVSSVAVLPFATMILGLAASRLVRERPRGAPFVAAYGAVVVATSLALYPLAIGHARFHPYLSPIADRYRHQVERREVTP